MCGIAGIYDIAGRPVDRHTVARMSKSIAHRGPDDHGMYVSGPIGLGHRRLAIIDLTHAAAQPMGGESGRLHISYNGEIYNFRELRVELEVAGHQFRSSSDTEVVLRAYQAWPDDWMLRLNGIFALALWDAARQRLTLARDRLGVKPLYYCLDGARLIFGSEIKAILQARTHQPTLSAPALVEYFTFQNILGDGTLFEGVKILPPGHVLTASPEGVHIRQYWDLEWREEPGDLATWSERVAETFTAAVRRQLVSDVPVGTFLSGGMDSASITAVSASQLPRLVTFTAGFDLTGVGDREAEFDERGDAETVAAAVGSEHYEMVVHPSDMTRWLPRVVWHLEDLRVGMCYQNFLVNRLASRFVKVALAGTGGDELFGGYPWRYEIATSAPDETTFHHAWYRYWCRLLTDETRPSFFMPDVWQDAQHQSPQESFRAVMDRGKGLSLLNQAYSFELRTFLHGLLVVEDKVSMAHGLEVRVPFLDNQLVELALRIPAHLKFSSGQGKQVLRNAFSDILPPEIVRKKKQGFSPPDAAWYRGPNQGYVRDLLLGKRAHARGILNAQSVASVVEDHASGRTDNRLMLWSLMCFEWWSRLFLDDDTTALAESWPHSVPLIRGDGVDRAEEAPALPLLGSRLF